MIRTRWLPYRAAVVLGGLFVAACSPTVKTRPAAVAPTPPAPAPAPSIPAATVTQSADDQRVELIAAARRHMDAGRQELALGHLERARTEFNLALEGLLASPQGARTDPRLRQVFDRMVDQISALELLALTEGQGSSEQNYPAASIDELLSITTFEVTIPSADLRVAVATDLARTPHDIPIPLNDRILACIDLFQGQLRQWFQEALTRGGSYLPMIQGVLRAEGLPLDLAYVPLIESAYNPNAVSRSKAKGTWQFVRGTATQYGLRQDWYVDERSDPEKSTVAAVKYLRALSQQFEGDWHLALASYNGGPGLVQRAMARTKTTDFWQLIEKPRALPRETSQYVPMILAAIVIARNPDQYGFDPVPNPPAQVDRIRLSYPVDLRRVAEWLGTSLGELQSLNPELRRWTTPIRYPQYELTLPKGTAAVVEARLAETAPEEMAALNWYVVKKGDTLTTIANKLRVKRTDLAEANYLSVRAGVKLGQKLIIPVAPTGVLSARAERPSDAGRQAAPAARVGGASTRSGDVTRIVYLVKSGDTLSSIARTFHTTVESLKSLNNLHSSRINIGDRLTIYTDRGSPPVH